ATGTQAATGLRFRGSVQASDTKFTDTTPGVITVTDFVARLKTLVAAADAQAPADPLTGAQQWHQIQYALLHNGAYISTAGVDATVVKDQWWKDKNDKPTPATITDIASLLKAAESSIGGNAVAWDNLTQTILDDTLRLRSTTAGDALTDLAKIPFTTFAEKKAFTDAIEAMVTAIQTADPAADLTKITWKQTQDYLLQAAPATVKKDADLSSHFYWWQTAPKGDNKLPVTVADMLATLMEQEADVARLTSAQFEQWMTFAVLDTHHTDNDAGFGPSPDPNLKGLLGLGFRKDKAGSHFVAGDMPSVISKLLQLPSKAKAKGSGYYDAATKTLTLSWDQVQQYFISATNELKDDLTSTAERYLWRPGGTASIPVTITTWAEMLDAANGVNTGTDPTALDNLTLSFVKAQNLRKADGMDYAAGDMPAIITAVKAAVAKQATGGGDYTKTSWDQVQYALLNTPAGDETTAKTESAAKYWWKDGGTKVTDYASLIAAAKEAADPTNPRPAKLNTVTLAQLKDKTFGAPLKAGLTGDDLQATEFTDTISFVAMMVELATQAGPGGTISWNQIQYALLHVPAALPAEGAANAEALDQYWWKDGGGRVTDLAGLLKAAEVAAADYFTAPLKTLTLGTINGPVPGTPGDTGNFYFRNTSTGGLYGTVADFASKMTDLATDVAIASPAPDGN
ncbi:MAG: hypothetical protein RSB55_07310, partial [Oscillospiraceae bacterium]